jgi:hypothetical protein
MMGWEDQACGIFGPSRKNRSMNGVDPGPGANILRTDPV